MSSINPENNNEEMLNEVNNEEINPEEVKEANLEDTNLEEKSIEEIKENKEIKAIEIPSFHRFKDVIDDEEEKPKEKPQEVIKKEVVKEIIPDTEDIIKQAPKPEKKKSYIWLLSLLAFLMQLVSSALPWIYIGGKAEMLLTLLFNISKTKMFGFEALRSELPLAIFYILAVIIFGLGGIILASARMKKTVAFISIVNFIVVGIPTIYIIGYNIFAKTSSLLRIGIYLNLVACLLSLFAAMSYISHYKERA